MKKRILILSAGLLLSAGVASADYDSCVAQSDKAYNDCMAKAATFVNDIEIQDAKDVCSRQQQSAMSACDAAEANRGAGDPDPNAGHDAK